MKNKDLKILYISSFLPRECGIATFCDNMIREINNIDPNLQQKVVAVDDPSMKGLEYPAMVRWQFRQEDLDDYKRTADYINESGADVVCLQHEYGLYGGFDGIFVIKLLSRIKLPVISIYHSIPVTQNSKRREWRMEIMKKIAKYSKFVVVTAEIGRNALIKECKIPAQKIVTVYHGAPNVAYTSRSEKEQLKEKNNLKGKTVISTFGMLTKIKGLDYGIEAMAEIVKKHPETVYFILGEAHSFHQQGLEKGYYDVLMDKAKKLGLEKNIIFVNRFLKESEIIDYLKMSDMMLLPYLTESQISSGVAAYGIVTGVCLVSTPFLYAKEMIGKDRGYYIDYKDSRSIAKVIGDLIDDPEKIESARKKGYEFGRSFTWPESAKNYIGVMRKAAGNKK